MTGSWWREPILGYVVVVQDTEDGYMAQTIPLVCKDGEQRTTTRLPHRTTTHTLHVLPPLPDARRVRAEIGGRTLTLGYEYNGDERPDIYWEQMMQDSQERTRAANDAPAIG